MVASWSSLVAPPRPAWPSAAAGDEERSDWRQHYGTEQATYGS